MWGPTRGSAARLGIVVACALTLSACVPFGGDPFAPSPEATFSPPAEVRDAAEQSRDRLSYTINLPAGWNDLTDEYLEAAPTSVLSGYWTMAEDFSTDGPYVTMSLFPVKPDAQVTTLSEDAAERWEADLGEPERGDSGYAETAEGGVITWASVTGDLDGERRTEHLAHILYGPYYMYVAVDTPAGDEESAHELLDALQTVTISGPVDLGERAGAPVPIDGRWNSYCLSIRADAQAGWRYAFQVPYDSSVWECPESSDYLGSWFVDEAGSSFAVTVRREPTMSLDARLEELGTPDAVGEVATSADGYETELLAMATFVAPNGSEGRRVDSATTAPSDDVAYVTRMYAFEDDGGGVTQVFVYDQQANVVPETDWLEPFIATLVTPNES